MMPFEHLITLTNKRDIASAGASPIDYIKQWVQNQWNSIDAPFVYRDLQTDPLSIAWQRQVSGGQISHVMVANEPARNSSLALRALSHYLIDLMPDSAM